MKHYSDAWISEWCLENGWTDLFIERKNNYWAFPPGAVMPEPIPCNILRLIKEQKGLCLEEKAWLSTAVIVALISVIFSYFFQSPMPIVFAFAFNAITVAQLEVEEII